MKKWYSLLSVSLMLFSSIVLADAKQVLQNRLSKLHDFYAQFKQVTLSADKTVVAEAEGEMRLKRPSYFNWQMTIPEKNTLISDGQAVWMYTPEIQQVTVTNPNDLVDNSLLLLITDNSDAAWQHYHIARKQDLFLIEPSDKNKQRYEIEVLPTGMIGHFTIIETDGQRSEYDLASQSLASQEQHYFTFDVPQGVTVDDQR